MRRHPLSGKPARIGPATDLVEFTRMEMEGDKRRTRSCAVCGGRVREALVASRPSRWGNGKLLDLVVCRGCSEALGAEEREWNHDQEAEAGA